MVKIPFSYPPGVRRWPPKPSCAPIVDKADPIVTLLPHFISSLRQAARADLLHRIPCRPQPVSPTAWRARAATRAAFPGRSPFSPRTQHLSLALLRSLFRRSRHGGPGLITHRRVWSLGCRTAVVVGSSLVHAVGALSFDRQRRADVLRLWLGINSA